MKATLLALFVALLMVGCGESIDLDDKETRGKIIAEAVDQDKLRPRGKEGELAYLANEQKPYTGWFKTMYDNGQVMLLGQCKDGKLMSAFAWKPNGKKCSVTNVKDGNGIIVVFNDDGSERRRVAFNDGKRVN